MVSMLTLFPIGFRRRERVRTGSDRLQRLRFCWSGAGRAEAGWASPSDQSPGGRMGWDLTLASISSMVSPWVAQPDIEDISAQKPPSSALWTITGIFIGLFVDGQRSRRECRS